MTDKLQEYAQLLINVGLNVQKDQYVVISSQVDCAYFARMCIAAAYEAGAKQVIMNWNDDLRLVSTILMQLTKYLIRFSRGKPSVLSVF